MPDAAPPELGIVFYPTCYKDAARTVLIHSRVSHSADVHRDVTENSLNQIPLPGVFMPAFILSVRVA